MAQRTWVADKVAASVVGGSTAAAQVVRWGARIAAGRVDSIALARRAGRVVVGDIDQADLVGDRVAEDNCTTQKTLLYYDTKQLLIDEQTT